MLWNDRREIIGIIFFASFHPPSTMPSGFPASRGARCLRSGAPPFYHHRKRRRQITNIALGTRGTWGIAGLGARVTGRAPGNRRKEGVQGCGCERRCVISLLSLPSPFPQGVGALQRERMSVYTPASLADSVPPPMLDRPELRWGAVSAGMAVADASWWNLHAEVQWAEHGQATCRSADASVHIRAGSYADW
jgi:hypothetical protein